MLIVSVSVYERVRTQLSQFQQERDDLSAEVNAMFRQLTEELDGQGAAGVELATRNEVGVILLGGGGEDVGKGWVLWWRRLGG
jgi:hypothetical protein